MGRALLTRPRRRRGGHRRRRVHRDGRVGQGHPRAVGERATACWTSRSRAVTTPASPRRLLLYSDLLGYRHELPVRSVVVLLRREANAGTMTGVLELRHAPGDVPYHTFRYEVVRLWQEPLAPLLAGPVGFLPLAPLTDEAEADLPGVVDHVVRRLRAETDRAEAAKMEVATFVLMGMRYEKEFVAQLFKGVPDMEESSTYQLIVERGERKALIRAIVEQGRLEIWRARCGSTGRPPTNQGSGSPLGDESSHHHRVGVARTPRLIAVTSSPGARSRACTPGSVSPSSPGRPRTRCRSRSGGGPASCGRG